MEVRTITVDGASFFDYAINFNPSIAHLGDDVYLVVFRSYRRYSIDQTQIMGKESNHPWLGGPGSETWWTYESGGRTNLVDGVDPDFCC